MAVKTSLSTSTGLTLSDIGSVYLDGTGDYLTTPTSSQFSFGTGDFTIECWAYLNSISQGFSLFAMLGDGVDAIPTQRLCAWSLYYDNFTPSLVLNRYTPTNVSFSFAWTPSLSRWYHISITRNGTSLRAFIDGVQIGTTQTTSQDYSSINATDLHVGRFIASGGISYFLNGYISNLRILKGTAAYIGNFIPPTVPLITTTSTSLLTCQGPTLRDTSSNNFTITQFGNAAYNDISPFTPILKENVVESGSIFFDGGSNVVTLPNSSKFNIAANQDFTLEAWVYLSSSRSDYAYMVDFIGDASYILQLRIGNAGFGFRVQATFGPGASMDSVYNNASYTQTNLLNRWTHLTLCRSGNSATFFFDGVGIETKVGVGSISFSNVNTARLGRPSSELYHGYISNVRFVIGTALYTSNFTPQPPLDNIPNTQLLLKSTTNNLWLKDDSINNFSLTTTGAPVYSSLSPETAISNISLRHSGLVAKELDEVTLAPGSTAQRQMSDGTLMVAQFSEVV
jgi:hypothetical protein